jgi:hypothetical protein
MPMTRTMARRSRSHFCGRRWWSDGEPYSPRLTPRAHRATIQLKVHRQIVQSIPLDDADIECLVQGLRLVTPCTQRIDRLIDLLEQIRGGGQQGTMGSE